MPTILFPFLRVKENYLEYKDSGNHFWIQASFWKLSISSGLPFIEPFIYLSKVEEISCYQEITRLNNKRKLSLCQIVRANSCSRVLYQKASEGWRFILNLNLSQ